MNANAEERPISAAWGREWSNSVVLTPMQRKVLAGICQGRSNKEIGRELGRSEATVKAHVTAIMRLLGVSNRTQAALVFTGRIA
jgi:DNA-binding NarL/FixJ family response regulator